MLDLKDKELEEFAYRLKTVNASQNKDMENLNEEFKQKIASLEAECQAKEDSLKSKVLEMRWMTAEFESTEVQKIEIFFLNLTFNCEPLGQAKRGEYKIAESGE